jgi:hypothetical protein
MSSADVTSCRPLQKEDGMRTALASPVVQRMVTITMATMLAGKVSSRGFSNVDFSYICRFSARDLLMRFHYGLGVGHLHAHQSVASSRPGSIPQYSSPAEHEFDMEIGDTQTQDQPAASSSSDHDFRSLNHQPDKIVEDIVNAQSLDEIERDSDDVDNPEFSLADHDHLDWEDVESDSGDSISVDEEDVEGWTG